LEFGGGEMELNESLTGLANENPLARRAAARELSDLAESDSKKFNDDDVGTVIRVLREEEDTSTVDHLLHVIEYVSPAKLNYLVNTGVLRVLIDVFMKNMGGVGAAVGREAMRLISLLAPSDKEGAEKLDLIGFILRTLFSSTDPYIRWYASMGLRKIDSSLIQKEAEEIIEYSTNAMAKENDERTRVSGALTLSLVASLAPEAFAVTKAVDFLAKALLYDSNPELQSCVALALQFIARKDPSQFKDTKIAETLFKTLVSKLDALEKNDDRIERETLVTVASTISILALKDPGVLAGGRAVEQIDLGEVISKALERSEGESEIRSILMSALVDLSRGRTSEYINNKELLEVLLKLIEGSEEEDTNYRSALLLLNRMASTYPSLFSSWPTLEKVATLAVKREVIREKGDAKSKLSPADVFALLWHSEKGSEILIDNLPKLYQDNPELIEHLLQVDSLRSIQGSLVQRGVLSGEVERKPKPALVEAEKAKPEVEISREERAPAVAAEAVEKRELPKSRGLSDKQKSLLQETFRKNTEIRLSELAGKLDLNEANLTEALAKLIGSGRLPYRIQDGILYLKKPTPTPAEIVAEEAKLPPKQGKKEGVAKCIWCGAELNLVDDKCPTCGRKAARCFICNEIIRNEAELEKCPFCGTLFHREHYREWAEVRKYCPKCRIPIVPS
jgi:hypothetical protein